MARVGGAVVVRRDAAHRGQVVQVRRCLPCGRAGAAEDVGRLLFSSMITITCRYVAGATPARVPHGRRRRRHGRRAVAASSAGSAMPRPARVPPLLARLKPPLAASADLAWRSPPSCVSQAQAASRVALGRSQPVATRAPTPAPPPDSRHPRPGRDPAVAADVLGLGHERERQRDLALLLGQLDRDRDRRAVAAGSRTCALPPPTLKTWLSGPNGWSSRASGNESASIADRGASALAFIGSSGTAGGDDAGAGRPTRASPRRGSDRRGARARSGRRCRGR